MRVILLLSLWSPSFILAACGSPLGRPTCACSSTHSQPQGVGRRCAHAATAATIAADAAAARNGPADDAGVAAAITVASSALPPATTDANDIAPAGAAHHHPDGCDAHAPGGAAAPPARAGAPPHVSTGVRDTEATPSNARTADAVVAGDSKLAEARERLALLDALVIDAEQTLSVLNGKVRTEEGVKLAFAADAAARTSLSFRTLMASQQSAREEVCKLQQPTQHVTSAANDTSGMIYCIAFPSLAPSEPVLSSPSRWCGPWVSTFPTHDPTRPPRIFRDLQPTAQDIESVIQGEDTSYLALSAMNVVSPDGSSLVESSSDGAIRTVQSEVMASYRPYLLDDVRVLENKTIGQLEQPVVYCKLGAAPDIAWVAKVGGGQYVLSVQEVERAHLSPWEGLQQVGIYACAAAAGLYNAGVDPDKILVPMSVCTGVGEMHGAAYMATPTFPVAITTSANLDLLSDRGAAIAHLHREMAKKQMERTLHLLLDASRTRRFKPAQSRSSARSMNADKAAWFRPSFDDAQVWLKIGGVANGLTAKRDVLMARMQRVFRKLYNSPASCVVCFPICFTTGICLPRTENGVLSALLFPNLKRDGYRCGLPADLPTARMYVLALKAAVAALHEAGVIHGDMYVSNIMWRPAPARAAVDIMLIDWDTAFIAKDGIPDGFERSWRVTPKWFLYQRPSLEMNQAVKLRLLDSFMVNTLDYFCTDDVQLWCEWLTASRDESVGALNSAFNRLQWLYVRHQGWAD